MSMNEELNNPSSTDASSSIHSSTEHKSHEEESEVDLNGTTQKQGACGDAENAKAQIRATSPELPPPDYIAPLWSISLVSQVKISSNCQSILYSHGIVYVGLEDSEISTISQDCQLTKPFLKNLGGSVSAIAVFEGFLYTLIRGRSYLVKVYDFDGQYIRQWCHTDSSALLFGHGSRSHKLCIVSGKVVIPDRLNSQFMIYSVTGQVVKRVPCSLLGNHWISVCSTNSDSIIVADYESSQVFRLDIVTGNVAWKSEAVAKPEGITCYKDDYVLVASRGSDVVKILSSKNGEVLGEVKDAALMTEDNSHVFDLEVFNNTLVVPLYNGKVLFYELSLR